MSGQIRVGRCLYQGGKGFAKAKPADCSAISKRTDPSYPGFTPIVVLTKSSQYGSLSPFELKNEQGMIMENAWQFMKAYTTVPKSTQYYSRWDRRVIWDHPAETHAIIKDGLVNVTPEYQRWREKGLKNPYPVRYPVGYHHRHKCLGHLILDGNTWRLIDYIEARKRIYLPIYVNLVRQQVAFQQLQQRLADGENLLIIEVDGPHQESLPYYQEKYGVKKDFIKQNTILVTTENMNIMLNDPKHPFGHGYCLAMALLNQV